mmetsp:Transcript_22942/g.59757  ORF Transcript_22942/g.59757 Transcript_22942/m.59757 type:complete len:225 (+) Transcript_22942:733-1407(+)
MWITRSPKPVASWMLDTEICASESSMKEWMVAPPLPMMPPQRRLGTTIALSTSVSSLSPPSPPSPDVVSIATPSARSLVKTRCSATRTWLMVPHSSIMRSCVPGKNSRALLSWIFVPDCACSSDTVAPFFPITLPAASVLSRNLSTTYCSPSSSSPSSSSSYSLPSASAPESSSSGGRSGGPAPAVASSAASPVVAAVAIGSDVAQRSAVAMYNVPQSVDGQRG